MLESSFNKLRSRGPATLPTQVLSYEICENFKSNYFEEHLRTTATASKFIYTTRTCFWVWML